MAPAALAALLTTMVLMAWSCALFWFMVTFVTPRASDHDPGGWTFAGPLTLAVAGLIVGATFGVGKASETLTAPGVPLGVAGILTAVVGTLLLHKSVIKIAERPTAAKTTITKTVAPAPEPAPVVVEEVVERQEASPPPPPPPTGGNA